MQMSCVNRKYSFRACKEIVVLFINNVLLQLTAENTVFEAISLIGDVGEVGAQDDRQVSH